MTKEALFYNFTKKSFTGYWNGKAKTFKPGAKQYMEKWRAEHYAKHLTNKVLLEKGHENYTSPKFPKQVPQFMEIFNKACIVEEDQDENKDDSDIINKQHEEPNIVEDKEPKNSKDQDSIEDEKFEGLN